VALIRLNKLLSQAGVASRRLADELIAQGRVEVNGQVVTGLGTRADPGRDVIRVDGRRLRLDVERRYLLMNKPRGVLSTRSDPGRRRTVIDVLAERGITGYFYPVGRLDYDSEGLILLTNDGDFADHVTHPRYELERTYEATVVGVPDERDLERLRRGVVIDGRKTLPAEVEIVRVLEGREPRAVLRVTLREGRNRQVRNMCDAIAHPVDRLRRISIGGVTDQRLRPGEVRDLTPAEIGRLMGKPGTTAPGSRSGTARPGAESPTRGQRVVRRTGSPEGASRSRRPASPESGGWSRTRGRRGRPTGGRRRQ